MFPLSVYDARVLLIAGAKPNSVEDEGNTPLMARRYARLMAELLVRGANPNPPQPRRPDAVDASERPARARPVAGGEGRPERAR